MLRRLVSVLGVLGLLGSGLVATAVPAGAIVNGSEIAGSALGPTGPYAWLARLEDASGNLLCSGSLIAADWVLTAAHCADGGVTRVQLGLGADVDVTETRVHPSWDDDVQHGFDFALMRLATSSTRAVAPVATSVDGVTLGATVGIAGWGLTPTVEPTAPREGTTTVASLTTNLVFTGASPALTCSGDSGGPLLLDGVLIGVTSFGDPSCASDAGFARVGSALDWLSDVTGDPAFVDEPPVATDTNETFAVGMARIIDRPAVDPEGGALTYAIASNPAHGTLSLCDLGYSTCRYTPAPGYEGPDSFTWTASDGVHASSPATVTIEVRPNTPPLGASQSVISSDGSPVLLPIAATDADGDPLQFQVVSTPSLGGISGSCDTTTCDLTFTPARDHTGNSSIAWTVSDGLVTAGPYLASVQVDATAAGLAVETIASASDATVLAQTIAGSDPVSNATFTGEAAAAGRFDGGNDAFGVGKGVVLSSGRADGVLVPPGGSAESLSSTDFGTAGTSLLSRSGYVTADAAVLEYDTVPSGDQLEFRYVLASEEYIEGYAYDGYDDAAVVTVGGVPCTVPTARIPSVHSLTKGIIDFAGDPVGPAVNPSLVIPNDYGPRPTAMSGMSEVLSCAVPVTPGVPVHVAIAVADRSETKDGTYDTAILVEGAWAGNAPRPAPLDVTIAPVTVTGHQGVTKFRVAVQNLGPEPFAFSDDLLAVQDRRDGSETGSTITALAPVAKMLPVGGTATVVMSWQHGGQIRVGEDHTILACIAVGSVSACGERAVAARHADLAASLSFGAVTSASTTAKVAVRIDDVGTTAQTVRPDDVGVAVLVNGQFVPTDVTNSPLSTRKLLRPGRATRFSFVVTLPALAAGDIVTVFTVVNGTNDVNLANNSSVATRTITR